MTVYTPKYPQTGGLAYYALELVTYPIVIFSPSGVVEFANSAARTLFDFATLPSDPTINQLIDRLEFQDAVLLNEQLEMDNSSGIHISKRDNLSYRISKKKVVTDDWIVSFEPVQAERENQQLRMLLDIGSCVEKSRDLKSMCERVISVIFESLQVDIAVIALLEKGSLKPVAWRGLMLEPEFGTTGVVTAEVEHAFETKQPVATGGAEWGGELGDGLTGTHFVVPLVIDSKTIGTLHLGALASVRLFSFSDDDTLDPAGALDDMGRSFLTTLAEHIATAIDNTYGFKSQGETEARLNAVISAIPDGVLVFDSNGKILFANPESKRICETEWTNLNARRPYRVCDEKGKPLPRPEWPFFKAVANRESDFERELIFDFGEKVRHVLVDVVHVDATTLVGTIRDITPQKESEQRYEDFLSAIGHELRSPLTPLSGLLQIVRTCLEREEPVDLQLVTRSEKQVRRLSRLIEAMLDVTRIETGRVVVQRERVDLNRVLWSLFENWRLQFPKHDIRIELPEEPTIVRIDIGRIEQVLGNLVDNAAKNSDPETAIGITLTSDPPTITISDQGIGMDDETLSRAFERFFQGNPSSNRGIGLGLYITKQIVEQHGGSIDIVSSVGEGTAVTITIPH